ncbi:MAG: DUF5666 domain-containing protein [Candidatus Binatia bacterium]
MKNLITAKKSSLIPWMIVLVALFSGCESIALMPRRSLDARDPPRTITATVNGIDAKLEEIYLRAGGNQHYVVNYTKDTRVSDRGRSLPVADLKVGDQVRVDLRENTGRRLYADQIRLESAGASNTIGIRTVEGTVERIIPERGFLELRVLNGDLLTVYVPESSSAATKDRFNRIRVGDQVRLEGERLSEDRLELLAFR